MNLKLLILRCINLDLFNSQSAAFGSYCEASGGKLTSQRPASHGPSASNAHLLSAMQNVPDLQWDLGLDGLGGRGGWPHTAHDLTHDE